MVRWRCGSCSVQVDTKTKDNSKYCFQGFACGEKGEASEELLKLGNLCCNCAKRAGIEQTFMIRTFHGHWASTDFTKNDFACMNCQRRGRSDEELDEMVNSALEKGEYKAATGLEVMVRGDLCTVENIVSYSPAWFCQRIEIGDQLVTVDGVHATRKNYQKLLIGDDTVGRTTVLRFRRGKSFKTNVQAAIEVSLVRVSAKELAARRREEFQIAKQKKEEEEAYEAVRVQREKYAQQLLEAKKEITDLTLQAEARFERIAQIESIRWKTRGKLRKMREECEEGAAKLAEAIFEGASKQLAIQSALNCTHLKDYTYCREAIEFAYTDGMTENNSKGKQQDKHFKLLHLKTVIMETMFLLLKRAFEEEESAAKSQKRP